MIFQVKVYFFNKFFFSLDAYSLKWLYIFVVFPWKVVKLVSGKLITFLCRCKWDSLLALLLLEGLSSKISQKGRRKGAHCKAPAAYQSIWGSVCCCRSPKCHCAPHLVVVQSTLVLVLTREEQRTGQLGLLDVADVRSLRSRIRNLRQDRGWVWGCCGFEDPWPMCGSSERSGSKRTETGRLFAPGSHIRDACTQNPPPDQLLPLLQVLKSKAAALPLLHRFLT